MADLGHKYVDDRLEAFEEWLRLVYGIAAKDAEKELERYFAEFEAETAKIEAQLDAGDITKKKYAAMLAVLLLTGTKWAKARKRVADILVNANETALNAASDLVLDAYVENCAYTAYMVEKATGIVLDWVTIAEVMKELAKRPQLLPLPSDDIPADRRWNMQKIESVIRQAMAQGKGVKDIAKEMRKVAEMDKAASERNARTAATWAQSEAGIRRGNELIAMGMDVKKQWIATMDNRVRHSHAVLDGQVVPWDAEFDNGCMAPGDPNGPASEIYNCRCRLYKVVNGRAIDVTDSNRFNRSEFGEYEAWKKYHAERYEARKK